jgi:hypothetical protein
MGGVGFIVSQDFKSCEAGEIFFSKQLHPRNVNHPRSLLFAKPFDFGIEELA